MSDSIATCDLNLLILGRISSKELYLLQDLLKVLGEYPIRVTAILLQGKNPVEVKKSMESWIPPREARAWIIVPFFRKGEILTDFKGYFFGMPGLVIRSTEEGWDLRRNKEFNQFAEAHIGHGTYLENQIEFFLYQKMEGFGLRNTLYLLGQAEDTERLNSFLNQESGSPLPNPFSISEEETKKLFIQLDQKERLIQKLVRSEKRYKKLFNESPVMMAVVNREGIFTECSKSLLRFSRIKRNELIGKHFSTLKKIFPEDISRYIRIYNNAVKGKIKSPFEVYIKADSGKTLSIECSVKLLKEKGNIDGFLIILRDITRQKEAEKNIAHLCFHDKLTGLYNRDFFEEEMERLNTKRQLPLAIIMGDVNGLRIINDIFGHEKGDEVLCRVGSILKTSLRGNDIVARWGGDEYIIVLPKISEEDARNILMRIKARLEEKSTKTMPLSVSFGLSIKDDIEKDVSKVIKEAEDKMCRGKMTREQSPHSYIISSLEKALEERDYETEEHVRRIKDLAEKLGKELGLDEESIDNLILLAALHDVGKISIADNILLKIGSLTDKEWEKVKKHPEIGYRIAGSFSNLAPIARGILYHHEWWDGNGYPEGIRGEEIPLISRIISVIDAYDAMTNDRPYRKALSKKDAIEELRKCSGSQFDPYLVKKFISLVEDERRNN